MTFKAGDKAIHQSYGEVEITYVPETARWIAYRRPNGEEYTTAAHVLKPIPAADPRIDVVAKVLATLNVGHNAPIPIDVESWLPEAHAVITALDDMPAAPAARYRDCDGDVWAAQDDGLYVLVERANGDPCRLRSQRRTLESLTEAHGPLTELEAPLKVGDSIRILIDDLEHAAVRAGDVLQVEEVDAEDIRTNAPRGLLGGAGQWSFARSAEGTGWERV